MSFLDLISSLFCGSGKKPAPQASAGDLRTPCRVRAMVQRDLKEVVDLESLCFPEDGRLSRDQLTHLLCCGNVLSVVAVIGGRIVASMTVIRHPHDLALLNLAVHPEFRRQGIARHLLEPILRGMTTERPFLSAYVREANIEGQLFLKALGFRCIEQLQVQPDQEVEAREVYHFSYELPVAAEQEARA